MNDDGDRASDDRDVAISRREFVISTSVVVGATAIGCKGDPVPTDASAPEDARPDVPDADRPVVVTLSADWTPDLVAPAGSEGRVYSDGNVAYRVLPIAGGGETVSWAGGHGRYLELRLGTSSSDMLRMRTPDNPDVQMDLEGFVAGRQQREVRVMFGDSVLTHALRHVDAALVV